MAETERQRLDRRYADLKKVRYSWETQWRDICDQVLPYRARWSKEELNKGEARDTKLINNTPARSLRILAAGLMAGITSPSREWFHLATSDKALSEKHGVRKYLDEVERIMREVLAQSGWYQALADGVYRDLGLIATAAVFLEESEDTRVRFETMTIGEYYLDVDKHGNVDTVIRERPMTIRQLVQRFGIENVSGQSRRSWKNGDRGSVVTTLQCVYPNDEFTEGRLGAGGQEFASRWWEKGAPEADGFLHEGGYEEFPVLAPRWNPRAGEVYGRGGPGWESRGDCKALQHLEFRLTRLVDKSTDPPMKASDAMRSARASLLPGDLTYLPAGAGHVFEPAMQVQAQSIVALQQHIERHETRVEEAFYVDLWMAMLADDRSQRATATEVEARRTEVMLQLGPLLENLNHGLLEPCITRTLAILQRQGELPEPPEELINTDGAVRVEFISVMHQAQKMTGIAGVRELVMQASALAQAGRPDAIDKLNVDAIVDELADMLGVKPELVLSDEQVAEIREAKAKQEQAAQQGDAMLAATEGAKNMSQSDPQKVADMAGMLAPAAAAQGGLL